MTAVCQSIQNNKSGKFQTQMTSAMESTMLPYFFEQSYNERTLVDFKIMLYFILMHHKGRAWEGIPSEARVSPVQCKERIPKQIIFDFIWDIYSFHEL